MMTLDDVRGPLGRRQAFAGNTDRTVPGLDKKYAEGCTNLAASDNGNLFS
jgi:hypothetical protein